MGMLEFTSNRNLQKVQRDPPGPLQKLDVRIAVECTRINMYIFMGFLLDRCELYVRAKGATG